MKTPPRRGGDNEAALVAQLASCVSVLSFFYYFQHSQILLYGDAVAHINIARRVFDSRTPGLLQLGTVWLPLPHLLMIPFLLPKFLWQTGMGGSLPSMAAYVFGVVGIFRLLRGRANSAEPQKRATAWVATLIFAGNPNLIYLQATAMTESLYLALFIWAVVYFTEFVRAINEPQGCGQSRSLTRCGLCLMGACLTRYDGWFVAAAMAVAAAAALVRERKLATSWRLLAKFVLLAGAVPVLWLGYNAAVYRNPLEFANGPYSAKAIERKTAVPGFPPHPGTDAPLTAASYFLKSAELNMLESNWHRLWVLVLLAGTGVVLTQRRQWPLLFLWTPLGFYTLSIAYGGVPIFIPPWWPFSIYNARYGMELLPAFAAFAAVAAGFLLNKISGGRARTGVASALFVLAGCSYASVWHKQPIAFREAWTNSRTRIALETELAKNLQMLPHDSTILMYLGDHGGALQQAGIPLRRVIQEGNHRTWKQPRDPEGLWERALDDPAKYADFVVGVQGDAVSAAVNRTDLKPLVVIHVSGQPPATIFAVRKSAAGNAGNER